MKATKLIEWLINIGEDVIPYTENIDFDTIAKINPDIVVSYGYKHILKKDVLRFPQKGCINLHISYLPFNRGMDPNVWSFLEDTPKGVTIHYMDEGVDTGDILFQKELFFDEDKETLESSYDKLQDAIVELFKENWNKIKIGNVNPQKQGGVGSVHRTLDRVKFQSLLKDGWKTPVKNIVGIYKERPNLQKEA